MAVAVAVAAVSQAVEAVGNGDAGLVSASQKQHVSEKL